MKDNHRHWTTTLRLKMTLLAIVALPTAFTGCSVLAELIIDQAFDRSSSSSKNLTRKERVRAFEEDFLRKRDFEEARKSGFQNSSLPNPVGHPRIFPALHE